MAGHGAGSCLLASVMGLSVLGRAVTSHKQIYYLDKYDNGEFEYRHVKLPKDIAKLDPKTRLMSE